MADEPTGAGPAPAPLMNIAEAAAYLNIPYLTLRDYVTKRLVPFTRIGRHVRFTPEHLAAIIAAGEVPVRQQSTGVSRRRARPRRTDLDRPTNPGRDTDTR